MANNLQNKCSALKDAAASTSKFGTELEKVAETLDDKLGLQSAEFAQEVNNGIQTISNTTETISDTLQNGVDLVKTVDSAVKDVQSVASKACGKYETALDSSSSGSNLQKAAEIFNASGEAVEGLASTISKTSVNITAGLETFGVNDMGLVDGVNTIQEAIRTKEFVSTVQNIGDGLETIDKRINQTTAIAHKTSSNVKNLWDWNKQADSLTSVLENAEKVHKTAELIRDGVSEATTALQETLVQAMPLFEPVGLGGGIGDATRLLQNVSDEVSVLAGATTQVTAPLRNATDVIKSGNELVGQFTTAGSSIKAAANSDGSVFQRSANVLEATKVGLDSTKAALESLQEQTNALLVGSTHSESILTAPLNLGKKEQECTEQINTNSSLDGFSVQNMADNFTTTCHIQKILFDMGKRLNEEFKMINKNMQNLQEQIKQLKQEKQQINSTLRRHDTRISICEAKP